MKKRLIVFIIISLLFISSTIIGAFLTFSDTSNKDFEIGFVDVDIIAYFEKRDQNNNIIETKYEDIDYKLNESVSKLGVVGINISNPNDIQYFDNFRVDILVKSSVNTFFRIAPYEQFTLTYEANGKINEVSITKDEYQPFNYNFNNFFDNRIKDGFFYYQEKVKRVNENTPLILSFIQQFDDTYPQFEDRYSLQIGFMIEAVQYFNGPIMNWGMENPPWDLEQTWEDF